MKRAIVLMIIFVIFLTPTVYASKASDVKKGNRFYKKGDFDSSVKSYQDALKGDPESPEVNFNLGTALYKNKNYGEAIAYLQKGLLSDALDVKKNAHFNLGDSLFAAGLTAEQHDINQAIQSLEESMRQFESVVNLDDKDSDARYNQNIVKKELIRLKKKQEQQKQQKQDQKKEQSENNGKENSQQSDSQQNKSDEQKEDQSDSSDSDKGEDKKTPSKPDESAPRQKDEKQQAQPVQSGQMSKEEAKDLLKQFEQNEQPAGLLNFGKKKFTDRPVLKDW